MTWRHAWIAYGVAHVGKSLLWTTSDLLTLYLLVATYAVDPVLAGALFLAGLAANALADMAVGIWLGRFPRHAAPLAGIALTLAAATLPATVLLAPYGSLALLAATLVFRVAYSGCDVPHNALLGSLGSDPARAAWLARVRTIGTALAALLAAWGASASVRTAPLLWCIALAALVIGSTMVPLLARLPLIPADHLSVSRGGRSTGTVLPLPLRFLAANVIGILALAALAKAVLHLPASGAPGNGTMILTLLIGGRTLSALIPIRLNTVRRGIAMLAAAYVAAAGVAAGLAWSTAPAMLVLLGLAMGATNLVGWALLPSLAQGPRGYGLYTMASKLGLGAAGLALAGGLGRVPTFTPTSFDGFAYAVAGACIGAALLARLDLTSPNRLALSA